MSIISKARIILGVIVFSFSTDQTYASDSSIFKWNQKTCEQRCSAVKCKNMFTRQDCSLNCDPAFISDCLKAGAVDKPVEPVQKAPTGVLPRQPSRQFSPTRPTPQIMKPTKPTQPIKKKPELSIEPQSVQPKPYLPQELRPESLPQQETPSVQATPTRPSDEEPMETQTTPVEPPVVYEEMPSVTLEFLPSFTRGPKVPQVSPELMKPEVTQEPMKPEIRPEFTEPEVRPEPTKRRVRSRPGIPPVCSKIVKPQVRPESVRPLPGITSPQTRPVLPEAVITKPQPVVKPSLPTKPQITAPQMQPEPLKPRVLPEAVKTQPSIVTPEVKMEQPSVALKPTDSKECLSTTEMKINEQYQRLKANIDPKGAFAEANLAEKYKKIIPKKIDLEGYRQPEFSLQKLSEFIDTIIKQEKRNCDYLPFYHAGGAALAFLTDTQNFVDKINRQKTYKAPLDYFGKGRAPRLIKGEFRTVDDLNQYIKAKKLDVKAKLDHNDLISPHLASVSFSMLDANPIESAIGYYFRSQNINLDISKTQDIVKNILKNAGIVEEDKIRRYYDILNNYLQSIHAIIIQFFVKKGIINDVVYLAQPFGAVINTSTTFRNLTEKFIENYQNMSSTNFTTYLRSIDSIPRVSTLKDLRNTDKLQARILIDSPLLNRDNLKFSIYYGLNQDAAHSLQELQQELYRQLQQDLQATPPMEQSGIMPGIFNAEKEIIKDIQVPTLQEGVVN